MALEKASKWYAEKNGKPFRLFGAAGVGKTTLAREIAARLALGDVVFGAYTGKAASVLTKRGVPATTIHSAIYRVREQYQARVRWEEATRELADIGLIVDIDNPQQALMKELEDEIAELEAVIRRPAFDLNPMSEWAHADLIVLDEVSMVNESMAYDIESFGVPVLVLGDPAQLPPVKGFGHYIDATPDVLLETIHRQALDSPVIDLATRIRLSEGMKLGLRRDEIEVASISRAMQFDQVLCWRNATRWKLIERIRAKLGRPAGEVVAGDRVICLVNNKDLGVLNGQTFQVLDVKKDQLMTGIDATALLLREEGTDTERWIEVYPEGFQGLDGEATLKTKRAFRGQVGAFTFAHAITVHKSQGSEWDSVYVVDETPGMGDRADARRWLYTAASRARESVVLARTRA